MSEFSPVTGQPLEPSDPEVLAFRALYGADETATPGSLHHYETTLKGIAEIAPTPIAAREAAKKALEVEKISSLEREYPIIVNLLERSKSITPEEAAALREGHADQELRARVDKTMFRLRLRQQFKPSKSI